MSITSCYLDLILHALLLFNKYMTHIFEKFLIVLLLSVIYTYQLELKYINEVQFNFLKLTLRVL